jgi:diaminopimelate epimerase
VAVFRKMHGLGNDFVVLDARAEPVVLPEARIRRMGDRRRGIGFDQLLVLDPPRTTGTDAFLRIYNPDGGEAGACGNGTRCVADLLLGETGAEACVIETRRGALHARREGELITVDMGAAQLDWREIPLAREEDTLHLPIEDGPLSGPAAVGMGNPHCIFFVDDAEAVDLPRLGPALEHHPLFPERTNVEIVSLQPDGGLRVRVWERGAGITPACGSGTCAAAVAAHRRGLIDAEAAPVAVAVDGGALSVRWRAGGDGHVLMTGPVATSFTGETAL